jgi:hypothetical protein
VRRSRTFSGGVSPTNRFLMVLDGHTSRVGDAAREQARRLGFDVLLMPGGMTAILQVMDQLFGAMKTDYGQREHMAKVYSSGRALTNRARIGLWCQMKKAYIATVGTKSVISAVKTLGLYPVSLEACLANLASRGKAPEAEKACAGGNPLTLSDATLRVVGGRELFLRRTSELTEAAEAGSDGEASGDENEPPAKRSRRVNFPRAFVAGSDMEALLKHDADAAAAEAAAKSAKTAARKQKAAEKVAEKAAKAERWAVRKAEIAQEKAAKAARAAQREALGLAPRGPLPRGPVGAAE